MKRVQFIYEIMGCLLLILASFAVTGQQVFNNPTTFSSPAQNKSSSTLPSPIITPNKAFQAQVKTQADSVSKQINQEAKDQMATLFPPPRKSLMPPPPMNPENEAESNLPPEGMSNTAPIAMPPPQQPTYTQPQPTFNNPASQPPTNQSMPINQNNQNNNNQGNKQQGGWQIQY